MRPLRFAGIAAAMLLSVAHVARAQVYGLQSDIVIFNEATGAVTSTGIPFPGGGVYGGESAADPAGRRIFIFGSAFVPGQSTLTTVDLTTSTASQVSVTGTSSFIEYDPSTHLVYAVQATGVVAINPATGVVTPTGILFPGAAIYQGESAFDPNARRIFLLGSDFTPGQSVLTTISLATSTVSQVYVPGTSSFIEYDPASHLVYGLQAAGIVSMDPATGVVTPIGIPAPPGGVYQGESTFDVAGRRLFTLGSDFTPGQSILTTYSLSALSAAQVNVNGTSQFIEFVSPVTIPAATPSILFLLAVTLAIVGLAPRQG